MRRPRPEAALNDRCSPRAACLTALNDFCLQQRAVARPEAVQRATGEHDSCAGRWGTSGGQELAINAPNALRRSARK